MALEPAKTPTKQYGLKYRLRQLWDILTQKEKRRIIRLQGLLMLAGFAEMLGVAMLLPLLKLLDNPDMINEMSWLHKAHVAVGSPAPTTFIGYTAGAIAVLFLLKSTFLMFVLRRQSVVVGKVYHGATMRLFKYYLQAPYVQHLKRNTSEMLRNVERDIYQLIDGAIYNGMNAIAEMMVLLFLTGFLIYLDPVATLSAAAVLVIFSRVVHGPLARQAFKYGEERREATGVFYRWVNQGLNALKIDRLLGREQYCLEACDSAAHTMAHTTMRVRFFSQVPKPIHEVLFVGAFVVFLILLVNSRPVAEVLTILGLFGAAGFRMLPAANRIIDQLTYVRASLPNLDGLYPDLKAATEAANLPKDSLSTALALPFNESITAKDVSFDYQDGRPVLQNVSFTIKKGQRVGFVGTSGAGKTTLIDVLLGLIPPSSGEIHIDKQLLCHQQCDLGSANLPPAVAGWQRHIGYIPQSIYLLDGTIRDNVAFCLPKDSIDDTAVWQALELAQLADFVRDQLDGLNTQVGENGVRLSGGQRQRIGIARALYHTPDVLVLDEATAALDNETEQNFMAAIDAMTRDTQRGGKKDGANQGGEKTIIMIAHRLSTVQNCDMLFVMDKGRIVASGSYDELLVTSPQFQALAKTHSDVQLVA